jgi:hypothetical protein
VLRISGFKKHRFIINIKVPEGNPPPKNILNKSSGVISASQPLWKLNLPLFG